MRMRKATHTATAKTDSTYSPLPSILLQRKCACGNHTVADGKCTACTEKKTALQRKTSNQRESTEVPPIVHEVLNSPGHPLDLAMRAFMEPRFDHDFSQVRLHTDAKAAESARAVNALAYTVGQDVVFGAGQYAPTINEGRRLLAHELTHVVQQQFRPVLPTSNLILGESEDHFETEAAHITTDILSQGPMPLPSTASPSTTDVTQQSLIQRQNRPGALPQLIPALHLPSQRIELDSSEAISAENPKLAQLAEAFKGVLTANPLAYIVLSGDLSSAAKMSSARESEERARMRKRMSAIRSVLEILGVPRNAVTIEPPYAFSSTSGGVINANLYKEPQPLPSPIGPVPIPGQQPGAAPVSPSPSLSDLLTFKFKAGPLEFTAEIPKLLSIKLPVALSAAKSLAFDLRAEASGTFSFSVTLNGNGLPHVQVIAKTQLSVDKEKGTSGGAGLDIQVTRTVCSASNPEVLKEKVKSNGEKLQKAMKELETAKSDESIEKLIDIASAIGDMYDAVDKSKSACKETPATTFGFGIQAPIAPSDSALSEPDPTKRPALFIGGSITIHF